MDYDPDKHGSLATPEEATRRLKERHKIFRTAQRLADYRSFGGGPPYIKQGYRAVRYPLNLLDEWARAINAKPIQCVTPLRMNDDRREGRIPEGVAA